MNEASRDRLAPALRRTWLFGAGADRVVHEAMAQSGADVLIQDLEDFTPPVRRHEARALAPALYQRWREAGALVCVRINPLEAEGNLDLQDVMPGRPDIVAYPKSATALHMRALDASLTTLERALGIPDGTTEILPVCETALGVVNLREIAGASPRIRCALLGAEDLATDLCAERSREAVELDYARRRFVLECRAAGVEPVDAPYTFSDVAGAVQEARHSRRLGYRTKSLVRPDHALSLRDALTPNVSDLAAARRIVSEFEAARARGEERALVDGLWVEVPTYLNAKRLLGQP
ncbi:MAG: CoA ester lyase [Proteobacteria bacterium]|jgi:citrate lyase subunit beta/citryl-CoA lyase|nr:CoA ester lyase [Ramlibacter sp.]MCA0213136.1 CoA ester lyase [Pseudomonadota bacterium]